MSFYSLNSFMQAFGPDNRVGSLMWPNLKTPQNWLNTQDPAKGPPPRVLLPFVDWCLRGSYFVLALAALASFTSGIVEMLTAALLGIILDIVLETGQKGYLPNRAFF